LQDKYGLSVELADALLLLPEGCIVVVSPTLGILLDHYKPTVTRRLLFLSFWSFCVPMCYVMLIYGYKHIIHDDNYTTGEPETVQLEWLINPVYIMIFLGISYACTNCMVW
jgi:hypothetical protein